MIDRVRDYIGWWMLIPAVVIMFLQIPGCVQQQEEANLKTKQIMTQHCASQGKTFMIYPNDRRDGLCI